jgi:hypothetical protein
MYCSNYFGWKLESFGNTFLIYTDKNRLTYIRPRICLTIIVREQLSPAEKSVRKQMKKHKDSRFVPKPPPISSALDLAKFNYKRLFLNWSHLELQLNADFCASDQRWCFEMKMLCYFDFSIEMLNFRLRQRLDKQTFQKFHPQTGQKIQRQVTRFIFYQSFNNFYSWKEYFTTYFYETQCAAWMSSSLSAHVIQHSYTITIFNTMEELIF